MNVDPKHDVMECKNKIKAKINGRKVHCAPIHTKHRLYMSPYRWYSNRASTMITLDTWTDENGSERGRKGKECMLVGVRTMMLAKWCE